MLIGLIFGGIITIAFQANAERVTYTAPETAVEEPTEVQIEVKTEWSVERLKEEVHKRSVEYGVSYEQMWVTIMCESGGSTTVQSYHRDPNGPNGRENSWGVAQFNLDHNPQITQEQATDPEWSVNEMALWFSNGLQRRWTCWRDKYE